MIQPGYGMENERADARDGMAGPVSRDQILRSKRGQQGKQNFPCSADDEQDWQHYPVDPYFTIIKIG